MSCASFDSTAPEKRFESDAHQKYCFNSVFSNVDGSFVPFRIKKYEKGTNRIGASRLQQISHILQVPVSFFFEGAPAVSTSPRTDGLNEAPSPAYVSDFLATSDGLALTKAFMRISDSKLRRRIVDLVEQIAVCDKY